VGVNLDEEKEILRGNVKAAAVDLDDDVQHGRGAIHLRYTAIFAF